MILTQSRKIFSVVSFLYNYFGLEAMAYCSVWKLENYWGTNKKNKLGDGEKRQDFWIQAGIRKGKIIASNNSMTWVRERTIPTERQPLVGEVSADFLGREGAKWSEWRIHMAVFLVS
jgi:hypothetical protein